MRKLSKFLRAVAGTAVLASLAFTATNQQAPPGDAIGSSPQEVAIAAMQTDQAPLDMAAALGEIDVTQEAIRMTRVTKDHDATITASIAEAKTEEATFNSAGATTTVAATITNPTAKIDSTATLALGGSLLDASSAALAPPATTIAAT